MKRVLFWKGKLYNYESLERFYENMIFIFFWNLEKSSEWFETKFDPKEFDIISRDYEQFSKAFEMEFEKFELYDTCLKDRKSYWSNFTSNNCRRKLTFPVMWIWWIVCKNGL